MEEMKVFVVNLGKYNEGKETGRWFTVPVDFDVVKKELGLNRNYEEYAIHDYELPFEIGEYTSIEEVNRLAELVEEVVEAGIAESDIKTLCDELSNGIEELAEKAEDIVLYSDASCMEDVAYAVVEEGGGIGNLPLETREMYFDYEAYGRDMEINEHFVLGGKGMYRVPM